MTRIIGLFSQTNKKDPAMDIDIKPKDEQYPLLKVTGGLEDNPKVAPDTTIAYPQRRSPKMRWPEKISTCWMSFILLGICVLTLYTIGVALTRRRQNTIPPFPQRFLLLPTSTFKPKSEVYFVQIIKNKHRIPIVEQESYFKHMASTYPNLRFKVIYLIDDTMMPYLHFSKHGRFNNYMLMQNQISTKYNIFNEMPNMNISVINLTKYLSLSLSYKWQTIPKSLTTLYARIYTIWQYGGISIDFNYYYDKFIKNEDMGYEIKDMLNKFNNGLMGRKELVSSIEPTSNLNYVDAFLDQALALIDYTFTWYSNNSIENTLFTNRKTNDSEFMNNRKLNENLTEVTTTKEEITNETVSKNVTEKLNEIANITSPTENNKNKIQKPRAYYFSVENIGPVYSYFFPKTEKKALKRKNVNYEDLNKKVLIDTDAKFMATYSKFHPFLGHLLTLSGYDLHKYFIEEEVFFHCSNFFIRNNNCDVVIIDV